jgi:heptosyltransferase-2
VRALEKDARRIEDVVSMSAELEDCDLIVDLHGNARTRLLTFRQKAPVLRAPSYRWRRSRWVHARWSAPPAVPHALERYARSLVPIGVVAAGAPRMHAGAENEAWAADWMKHAGWNAPPIALCPGAHHATKRWPEPRWIELDRQLASLGIPRLYASTAGERRALAALAEAVERDASARWCVEPLGRVAALLSHARAAVCGDTGLMHLSAARGVRVVAMFGSTSPVLGFAPAGTGHRVICRNLECQPCTLHGRERCPRGHFRCMLEITPETVVAELSAALTGGR